MVVSPSAISLTGKGTIIGLLKYMLSWNTWMLATPFSSATTSMMSVAPSRAAVLPVWMLIRVGEQFGAGE